MKRRERINVAIARLANLYPFGALQADTMPAEFLDTVADDIEGLRRGRNELLEALRKLVHQERREAGTHPSPAHLEAEALIARIES